MAIPERIHPTRLADYLEIISKAMLQAGVSWKLIESKWPAFKEVFEDFDPALVSKFSAKDIDRLMEDARILRSRKKLEATVKNAQTILDLDKEHNGFANYLRSKSSYEELSADMRKRFKFVGELSVYYFLFRIHEPVPPFESWLETIEGDHPRMKEMVELARQTDPSAGR